LGLPGILSRLDLAKINSGELDNFLTIDENGLPSLPMGDEASFLCWFVLDGMLKFEPAVKGAPAISAKALGKTRDNIVSELLFRSESLPK